MPRSSPPCTEASASAKKAFSSGVPTVIRSAPGAPNAPIGRTIAPWRSSASKSAGASSPTSTKRKFATAGPAGSSPCSRSVRSSAARPSRGQPAPLGELRRRVDARERGDLGLRARRRTRAGSCRSPGSRPPGRRRSRRAGRRARRSSRTSAARAPGGPPSQVLRDAVGIVGPVDVLEVRLVEHGEDVLGDALEVGSRAARASSSSPSGCSASRCRRASSSARSRRAARRGRSGRRRAGPSAARRRP